MIGIALADTHLGYAGAGRIVGGRSGRELDLEKAWHAAIEIVVQVQPQLVTIAGDVFHSTRPSFHAVKAFQDGIRRIVRETSAQVVVLVGNHEAVRTAAALTPVIVVDGEERVHVVTEAKLLRITLSNDEVAAVHCYPFNALTAERAYEVAPHHAADVNILVVHGQVRASAYPSALPSFYAGESALDVSRSELAGFDAICCGDYHQFTQLGPMAFYSGSIERTSSNIWQEHGPKGVVRYDTLRQTVELLEVPTRKMSDYDLGDFDLPPRVSADELNDVLRRLLSYEPQRDALLRLSAIVERSQRDSIDWKLVRELKALAYHFVLAIDWAESESIDLGDRRARRTFTLLDSAAAFFDGDPEPVRAIVFQHLGIERLAA